GRSANSSSRCQAHGRRRFFERTAHSDPRWITIQHLANWIIKLNYLKHSPPRISRRVVFFDACCWFRLVVALASHPERSPPSMTKPLGQQPVSLPDALKHSLHDHRNLY